MISRSRSKTVAGRVRAEPPRSAPTPQDPQRARDLLTLWRVRSAVPSDMDAFAPTEDRLREVTPGLALTLGRLTGRRWKDVAEFVPDPSWGYVANDDARTVANRAVRLYGAAS